jgi:hypothetical protein
LLGQLNVESIITKSTKVTKLKQALSSFIENVVKPYSYYPWGR